MKGRKSASGRERTVTIMKDDSISRKKALDTVRTMYDRCDTGDVRDYRDLMLEAFEALPSAQPTLYGYNLRNLIVFADAVNKKGISDFEIEDFVRNVRAAWEYAWEEFQRTQKEALDSIMRGDHHD